MHLWQRLVTADWLAANEDDLRRLTGNDLVVVVRPGKKRVQIEVACRSRSDAERLIKQLGGRARKSPRMRCGVARGGPRRTRGCVRSANWSLLDLGTGSGIFALAAKVFDASTVVALDNDPVAISTARANANLNRIRHIDFRITDA